MTNMKKVMARCIAIALVAAICIPVIGLANVPAACASSKSATVKKAKKGTKVTIGNYKYKITKLAKKKSTVSVIGLTAKTKKKLTKVVIPKTIKIKSKKGKNKGTYKYKVTAIANNAFKNNNKIKTVKIGDNVITIGKKAFYQCSNLRKVVMGKKVRKIGKLAFGGCFNLEEVVVPKGAKIDKISDDAFKGCDKLGEIDLGPSKEDSEDSGKGSKDSDMGKTDDNSGKGDSGNTDTDGNQQDGNQQGDQQDDDYDPWYEPEEPEEPAVKATDYTYEIIPLVAPFGSWFYIKTDNPDPNSFGFVDKDTKYTDGDSTIVPFDEQFFTDVKYENRETKRVAGGYIALGSYTDGGELTLQQRIVTGRHGVYNVSTGETTYTNSYNCTDTDVKYTIQEMKNVVDYLIEKYGDSSKSYFDNLSGIQAGFDRECLYSGVYVLGEEKKSEDLPFYALSTSPHADQIFYIQDPYYRVDSKYMFMSQLYPMIYDSLGFPSIMASVATTLDSSATVEWDSYTHYLVNITYNGETQSFGGAGNGGGQGINEDQIKYRFSFDGSVGDTFTELAKDDTIVKIKNWICEYGAMTVPEPERDLEPLTWAQVRKTVGKDGSYVRLITINSIYFGGSVGYSFMYDDGSTTEGTNGWGSVGHFTNAWYDGHYFNNWEQIYTGRTFNKFTANNDCPSIILKDPVIKLPDDGREYYYYYGKDITEVYDPETGVWEGFHTFFYDSETETWEADITKFGYIKYKDEEGKYHSIDDQQFLDDWTITMDEALAMNLDRNTNEEPTDYYIYDGTVEPGTHN